MEKVNEERVFSVELKSKSNIKTINFSNGGYENVLLEGTIGKLQYAKFTENIVLEVVGDKGTLRINLKQEEIKQKAGLVEHEVYDRCNADATSNTKTSDHRPVTLKLDDTK